MGQSSFKPKREAVGRSFNGRAKIDAMYDGDWEKYRARFLKVNYQCYACGSRASVVDHLIPHQGNHELFRKLDNHIPLCVRCHNTVTSQFDRNAKSGVLNLDKVKWLNMRRFPTEKWHPRKVKVLAYYK